MGLFGRINYAGGIDTVAKRSGVGRVVVTKMIRGEAVDAKLAGMVLDHLDASEAITRGEKPATKNTLITAEESRGRRAWS